MNKNELRELVTSIDPINAEYIMKDDDIENIFDSYNRYTAKNEPDYADRSLERLRNEITAFDARYLTPANVKVGDGATVNYYTDRHAGTIVKVTKSTITIRRDKAIKSPNFKPEFIIGGFSAHCTNQNEQDYTYEPDENGELITLHWSSKYNQYGQPGDLTASKGRHEFYDYNF